MATFSPTRNRDAWAAIRGFLYQVDLTILRWLDLGEHEYLQLECGEDIDLVASVIGEEKLEVFRRLEQVKSRTSRITLMSSSAIAALANSVANREANPGAVLRFRFTTNAEFGREQRSPFPDRKPGIEVWEQLRLGVLDEGIAQIRRLLKRAVQPTAIDDVTWEKFHSFRTASSDTELLDFVHVFEWRTAEIDFDLTKPKICDQLVTLGHALNREAAGDFYNRLCVRVFKLLSQRGRKVLDRTELERSLKVPVAPADQRLIEFAWFRELENRVTLCEAQIEVFPQRVTEILEGRFGLQPLSSVLEAPPLLLDPPLLVANHVRRTCTVESMVQDSAGAFWIAVYGSLGCGKTHLAVLTAERISGRQIWLGLRDLDDEKAAAALDRLIDDSRWDAPTSPLASESDYGGRLAAWLGKNGVFGLDDLPMVIPGQLFADRLLRLARQIAKSGARLVTTSAYRVPDRALEVIAPASVAILPAPSFTNEEVQELLATRAAPSELATVPFAAFINTLAGGHPTLLGAVARFLEQQHWRVSEQVLQNLFTGVPHVDLRKEVLEVFLRRVQDPDARNLLYRLNVASEEIGDSQVEALASVPPSLASPRELLHRLLDVWVEPARQFRIRVQPLARLLGSADLASETRSGCHIVLARGLLARRSLSEIEAARAVLHFVQGGATNDAGFLLYQALESLLETGRTQDSVLTAFWRDVPLPAEMRLALRIAIRAAHVAVSERLGRDSLPAILDLRNLVSASGPDDVFFAFWSSARAIAAARVRYFAGAVDLAAAAMEAVANAERHGVELSTSELGPAENSVWLLAGSVSSTQTLETWLGLWERLTERQKARALVSPVASAGCASIAGILYDAEARKGPGEQDWANFAQAARAIADRARSLGLDLLAARILRYRVCVLDDHVGPDAAQAATEEALALFDDNPPALLTILEGAGTWALRSGDLTLAERYLLRASELRTEVAPELRASVWLGRATLAGSTDHARAERYALHAVEILDQDYFSDEISRIRAYAELGVAHWQAGHLAEAYGPLDRAAKLLLGLKDRGPVESALFAIFGHALGYITHAASHPEEPLTTLAGEPYAAPRMGMFRWVDDAMASQYRPGRDSFLANQMATLASAVGLFDNAVSWAEDALARGRTSGQIISVVGATDELLPALLVGNKITAAFELGAEAARAVVASGALRRAGGDVLQSGLDPDEILAASGPEEQLKAEDAVFHQTLGPAMFRICAAAIGDRPLAGKLSQELITLCRDRAEGSAMETEWAQAAEILEMVFQSGVPSTAVLEWVNHHTANKGASRALGYLAFSAVEDVPLESAFVAHLRVVVYFGALFGGPATTQFRRLIVPYVLGYWSRAIEREPFRFSGPASVRAGLGEAASLRGLAQARRVLQIVHAAFRIRLPDSDREWLYGDFERWGPSAAGS